MLIDLQHLLEPTDVAGLKSVLMGRERPRTEPTGITIDLTDTLAVIGDLDPDSRRRDWDRAVAQPLRLAVASVPRRVLVDIRCWRFLAVVPLRPYVLQRWMPEWNPESGALTTAQAQRFLGSQSNQGFSRNAIGRLWRVVDALDDPELIDLVLDDQSLFSTVFERDLGAHGPTARACVRVLAGRPDEEKLRATQELNMLAATVALEALDQKAIERHLLGFVGMDLR
jgi:uncharacterized protein DUF6339